MIFHNAACVLAELGDVKGAIAQCEKARRARYGALDVMKDDCARLLPAVARDKRFRALP